MQKPNQVAFLDKTPYRPGALLLNADCNEQMFSSKSLKILAQIRLIVFEKNALLIPKKCRHRAQG